MRRVALAVGSVTLGAVALACSSTGAEDPAPGTGPTTFTAPGPEGAPGPTTLAPVTLPDPGVAPGGCAMVVTTPAASLDAQDSELCRPAPERARDVGIVLVHGGGGIGGNHTGMTGWSQIYTDAGYTTLSVNYHLFSPGSTESPVFPVPEQDVKAAVQWLRGSAPALGLDPERIALHGVSAGARLGAVAFTTPGHPLFDSPELWAAIPDHLNAFVGFYSTYDGTMQYDRQYYGGDRDDPDPEVRRRWQAADSVVNAAGATGPVVLFTGSLDLGDIIPQQEYLAAGVEVAGYQASAHVVEGAEHGFDTTETGLTHDGEAAAALLVGWFDRIFPQTDEPAG